MGEYPAGVADGPGIEANLQTVLNTYNSPFGTPVSYTHLRAHETVLDIVCRLLLEKKKTQNKDSAVRQSTRL